MTPQPSPGGNWRKRLAAALEGIRRGRPSVRHRQGDPALLELVTEPYSSVEETERRLGELLSAFEERDDRRAVFLSIYVSMTGAVADRIDRDGFQDPAWVSRYLVAFANIYRRAVRDYEADELGALADPWQLAFEAAEHGNSLVVQDAALGVNAHINYDLALALESLDLTPDSARKYEDHSAITEVIRHLVDDAQDALADRNAPGLETVDESLGSFDDWFWVFTIDECRDSAWRTAGALQSRFPPRRRLAHWINDITATGAAHLILASQGDDRVHDMLRTLEGSSSEGDRRV